MMKLGGGKTQPPGSSSHLRTEDFMLDNLPEEFDARTEWPECPSMERSETKAHVDLVM